MRTSFTSMTVSAIGAIASSVAIGFSPFGTAASAQTIGPITTWDFNVSTGGANVGTTTASFGSGTASLVGVSTTATFASGDGSSDPAFGTNADDGWNISTFPSQGQGNLTRGVQFLVSTVGRSNIQVQFDQRHSNTSSRYVAFQYTVDGTTWVNALQTMMSASTGSVTSNEQTGSNAGGLFVANAGDTWFNNRTVNLSSITAVNNNANFGFRILSTFAPSTSTYISSELGTSGQYGTGGTWRFDMVEVESVPEPTTIIGGMAALGVGNAVRRKWQKKQKVAV
jgi:uncharacterized protein